MIFDLAPGKTLGRYRLTHVLRDGESRRVFAAVDLADASQRAVIKVASMESAADAARLAREYHVMHEAHGPGVAHVLEHAVLKPHGLTYLALADGGTSLAAILAAAPEQRLEPPVAVAACQAIAESLAKLHARGWVHADIKPGNVVYGTEGQATLTDLEFALDHQAQRHASEPSSLIGTPPFIAPEVWRAGTAALTPAADVWALGVTLYLMLMGEYPFGEAGDEAIQAAIHRSPPPRLATLPRPLRDLLLILLTIDPTQRPGHGGVAMAAIGLTAEQMGIDLLDARAMFVRFLSIAPPGRAPAESTTIFVPVAPEPGTRVGGPAPPCPQPAGEPITPTAMPQRHAAEFFDIVSRAASPPARPVVPPPAMPTAPGPARASSMAAAMPRSEPDTLAPAAVPMLSRRAAARWYRRMNPQKNFPLSVVISGKQIRMVGGSGLGITVGNREIVLDADHPILAIEPWFPGCLISPPRADVAVTQETTVCRFWITPLVCGDLDEACVTIRYRGKVVETLPTPARVVTRTAAKVLAVIGLVSPLVSKAMSLAGWDPEEILRGFVPYLADGIAALGPLRSGVLLAAILLGTAAAYFYITRPLLSEEPEPALLPQPG